MALQCKREMSHDEKMWFAQNVPVESPAAYREAFIQRVRLARTESPYKQTEMARLLGMLQGHYKQFEKRSLLPHRYIAQFCLACQINEQWLMTGRGPMRRKQVPVSGAETA